MSSAINLNMAPIDMQDYCTLEALYLHDASRIMLLLTHAELRGPAAMMVACQLRRISIYLSYLRGVSSSSRGADGRQQAGQAEAVIAVHVRDENVADGTRINARHRDLPVCALAGVDYQRLLGGAQSYAGHVSPSRWRTCWR